MGQAAASAVRTCGQLGRHLPAVYSPRSSAYCSAAQYNVKVTTTASTSFAVLT
jgi:hypothetical protein